MEVLNIEKKITCIVTGLICCISIFIADINNVFADENIDNPDNVFLDSIDDQLDQDIVEFNNTQTTNFDTTTQEDLPELNLQKSTLASQGVIPLINNQSGFDLSGNIVELANLQYNMNLSDVDIHLHFISQNATTDIFSYAVDYFRSVGLGTSSDKGLLFVAMPSEKEITIQVITGYGLEGDLNDGKIGRFLDNHSHKVENNGTSALIDYINDVTTDLCNEISGAICKASPGQSYASSIGNGTTGGAGVARTYAVSVASDDCRPCERLNALESSINGIFNRLYALESASSGGGGGLDTDVIIQHISNALSATSDNMYNLEMRLLNQITQNRNATYDLYGMLMDAFMPYLRKINDGPDMSGIESILTKINIQLVDLGHVKNFTKSINDDIPKIMNQLVNLVHIKDFLKNIDTIQIPEILEKMDEIILALEPDESEEPDEPEDPEQPEQPDDDDLIDIDIESILILQEKQRQLLEYIDYKIGNMYTTLEEIKDKIISESKINEIIKTIENIDFDFTKIVNENGTTFWDFLSSFFDRIFDFLDGLIDTIIGLVIPDDSSFIASNVMAMSDLFNQKFSPVTTIKDEIVSTVQVEQKEFKDISVSLPIYGTVDILHTNFLTQAIPVFRNLVSGFMILVTAIWAYRKLSSGVLK